MVNYQERHRAKESLILLASHEGIGFGFGFGFTTPFGWLVYLLWFWFYDSQVKTALLHLTIIPRARVGYEMVDSQRGA